MVFTMDWGEGGVTWLMSKTGAGIHTSPRESSLMGVGLRNQFQVVLCTGKGDNRCVGEVRQGDLGTGGGTQPFFQSLVRSYCVLAVEQ